MNKFLKYFLCILLSILSITFIVDTISFFTNMSAYLLPAKIAKNPTHETFVNAGNDFEKSIDDITYDLKEIYGENYPALGILYYRALSHYSSVTLIQNFMFSIIAGFALGNIIFLTFIYKAKKAKLFALLVIVLFITSFFLALSDILIAKANAETIRFGLSEIFWNMELYAIPFTIISFVVIGIKKLRDIYIEVQNS